MPTVLPYSESPTSPASIANDANIWPCLCLVSWLPCATMSLWMKCMSATKSHGWQSYHVQYTYKIVSLNTSTYSLIPSLPHAQLSLLAVCDENWWCGRLGMRLVSSTLSNSVISLNKILWIRSSGFYMYLSPTLFFSSFSVSSYKERLSDTNLRSETFADVLTECSSH